MELAADRAVAGARGMVAAMTSGVGIVVLAGASIRLAHTMASVEATGGLALTCVVPPLCDPRTRAWLQTRTATRNWKLVDAPTPAAGACWRLGVQQTEAHWLILLDSGDRLGPGATRVIDCLHQDREHDLAIAAARLIALGVDELVTPPGPDALVDPAHPLLRSTCWRRERVLALDGLDPHLPAAVRYALWLRLASAGCLPRRFDDVLVELDVGPGTSAFEEMRSPDHATAVARAHARHVDWLSRVAPALLEQREQRLASLKSRHVAILARRSAAIAERQAPDRIDDGLALDAVADRRVLPRRVTPRSRDWGYERGGPLDRAYIERFVAAHRADIRGTVLEVQESDYSRRFGDSAVTRCDVLDADDRNAGATVISDLRHASNIPDDNYDCIILTQTLHVIDDMERVVAECWRMLKPGGVLLATLPCVSRVCLEYGPSGDLWRVTPAGARQLFARRFGSDVHVTIYGNALSTSAFTLGLGGPEVEPGELDWADPYNPTLVGVRAAKRVRPGGPAIVRATSAHGVVLLYHRVGGLTPDPHRLSVSLDAFADQIHWLASNCAVLPIDEFVTRLGRRALPPRAVTLTFDDGYRDTLVNAGPIVRQHRVPATCFVATEALDGEHVFWWDRLAELLLGDGEKPSSLAITLDGATRQLSTARRGERLLVHQLLYAELIGVSPERRDAMLGTLTARSRPREIEPTGRRMTALELRELSAQGIAIGAHTVTHPRLADLSPEAQYRELAGSRATLERVAGVQVTSVAYPFGSYTGATLGAAADAGFAAGFTCEPRAATASDAALALPRFDPQEAVLERFAARVNRLLDTAAP